MSSFVSPRTLLLIQDECYKHRYIRSKDDSFIVERPQRLRALKVGFSAAISRLEELVQSRKSIKSVPSSQLDPEAELANALDTLSLSSKMVHSITDICDVYHHPVSLQYLSADPAVRMIHAADAEGGFGSLEHLDRLAKWARESEERIKRGECEIPTGFPQNDLYMCPKSYRAICGAVDTVREAVDRAMRADENGTRTVFAAIRPPGHHCSEDIPSGFCFVNNVAIGAAHAHLKHKVKRVIIFDIDLHHGNGTQAIAWSINAETHRRRLAQLASQQMQASGAEASSLPLLAPPGLQIFYASLHDILSFPCEDGDPALVRDASVSISGLHGQFIENVHLQPYTTHQDFWERLYPQYRKLFSKALEFLQLDSSDTNVPVFISCGFDASELEYESMSRHGRKVPVGFYYKFTKDAKEFALKHANGRVISVLEGGYSDQTLMAGGMAHLVGLVENGEGTPSGPEEWWSENNLELLEKASKKRKGRQSMGTINEPWLERAIEILAALDPYNGQAPPSLTGSRKPVVVADKSFPNAGKVLRDRKKPKTPPDASGTLPVPTTSSTAARPRKSNSSAPSPRAKDKIRAETHPHHEAKVPLSRRSPPIESDGPIGGTKDAGSVATAPTAAHSIAGEGGANAGDARQGEDPAPNGLGVESEPPPRKLPRLILRVREPGT